MAGSRRPGRFRIGYRGRLSHAALSRAAVDGDHAAHRPRGARQRHRSMGQTLDAGAMPLSTQHYGPDVIYPRGIDFIADFSHEPWPRWTFRFPDGTAVVARDHRRARRRRGRSLTWRRLSGSSGATLHVRPLLSGRDYHALMRENAAFDFTRAHERRQRRRGGRTRTCPRSPPGRRGRTTTRPTGIATSCTRGSGTRARLRRGPGVPGHVHVRSRASETPRSCCAQATHIDGDAAAERCAHPGGAKQSGERTLAPLDRAAESYVVRRGTRPYDHRRLSVVHRLGPRHVHRDARARARGAAISTTAASILADWAGAVSHGMLPNRFPDEGEAPQYNAVDASLWFVVVA